jgi:hypothetical protein
MKGICERSQSRQMSIVKENLSALDKINNAILLKYEKIMNSKESDFLILEKQFNLYIENHIDEILNAIEGMSDKKIIMPTEISSYVFEKVVPELRERIRIVKPKFDIFICQRDKTLYTHIDKTVYLHIHLKAYNK